MSYLDLHHARRRQLRRNPRSRLGGVGFLAKMRRKNLSLRLLDHLSLDLDAPWEECGGGSWWPCLELRLAIGPSLLVCSLPLGVLEIRLRSARMILYLHVLTNSLPVGTLVVWWRTRRVSSWLVLGHNTAVCIRIVVESARVVLEVTAGGLIEPHLFGLLVGSVCETGAVDTIDQRMNLLTHEAVEHWSGLDCLGWVQPWSRRVEGSHERFRDCITEQPLELVHVVPGHGRGFDRSLCGSR